MNEGTPAVDATQPLVSIAVTCYNYGRYVAQAVDSLLSQSYPNIEVVVIDDASSDSSAAVLAQYAGDARVRVIRHETNLGPVASWNDGLTSAKGDFVAILDADDFALDSDAVRRQMAIFQAHPEVGFVWSGPGIVDSDGNVIHHGMWHEDDYVSTGVEELRNHLIWEDQVQHSGTMIRRTCLEEVGLHDASMPHASDWDLWFRLATRYSVGYVAAPLYGYRIHTTNMSHSAVGVVQSLRELTRVIDQNFARMPAELAAQVGHLRLPGRRNATLHTIWLDLAYGRTARIWRAIAVAPLVHLRVLIDRGYYAVCARALYLTVFGRRRYRRRFGGFEA